MLCINEFMCAIELLLIHYMQWHIGPVIVPTPKVSLLPVLPCSGVC